MLGWLWALPGGDTNEPDAETIGSLQNRKVEIPAAQESIADSHAALEQYRKYLEMPEADPSMRVEAMRRLGDLNLEAGEEEQIDNPAYETDKVFHADAIRLYEELLGKYEAYDRADVVLYKLAHAYESAGRPDDALAVLDRLVREYPDSVHIDEAQFRRGEILFMKRHYYPAGEAYLAVVSIGPRSSFYQQSLYKYGWAQFKQAGYDQGIRAFLNLVNLRLAATVTDGSQNADVEARLNSMSRPDRELVDDALRVLSLSFSYIDGPETIGVYLDRRDRGDSAYLLYGSLGSLYLEKDRYLDAARTFRAFVEREPFDAQSPHMSMQAIEAYKQGRFPSLVLESKEAYVDAYGLHSDYWAFFTPAGRPDVVKLLKSNLSDLAQHDHAEAQKLATPEAYARAAQWYRRYLEYFPTDPDSAKRSFLLGEILMESETYAEANTYYLRAAYGYPGYTRASEAAYAGLLASKAHLATLAGDDARAWEQQQLRQSLTFAIHFPRHEQAGPVLADAAENYYTAAEMDEAVVVAGRVLTAQPTLDADLRRVAWTVVAHGQFDLEHYARAEKAYIELRAMGGSKGLSGPELDERIAASIYRQAEAAQLAGNVDKAVNDYLRIASVTPNASIRATAVYDAATLLVNESRWQRAIVVLNRFRTNFPRHKFNDDATQKLAVAYQQAGQPVESAREFERIAVMASVSAEVHREALWNSAELYEQANERGAARRVWKQFVATFPEPLSESIEIRQRLADLAGDAGDTRDRRDWLEAIVIADAKGGRQRSDRSKTLAAKASLELAEPKRKAFAAVRLHIPLADSLKLKKKLMEDALAAYDRSASYDIAEVTTVATFRIAELYQQLSADLMESERPAGLNPDELEQYDILLEEQAFPFEEKAIELYEVNAARAASGVYDQWVVGSFAQLAVLMPARYAKFEKAESYVAKLY
jgi:TolA-binding protein